MELTETKLSRYEVSTERKEKKKVRTKMFHREYAFDLFNPFFLYFAFYMSLFHPSFIK